MAFDAHKNLAYSTVVTPPSPANSGTTLLLVTGQVARFPTVPFNATIWPIGQIATPDNAEIVRVTGVSVDTITITRAQEATGARTILAGDQIVATITAKTITDIEAVAASGIVPNVAYAGKLIAGDAVSVVVPGTTSWAVRNHADSANNFILDDSGNATLRGSLSYLSAVTQVIPGATSYAIRDNANAVNNLLLTNAGGLTITGKAGSGSGVAGTGHVFNTGASGGGTASGGDYTVNLGSETGVAKAGRLIVNRTSTQTDGGSYNGAISINETMTPASTVTGSTQAISIIYTLNGDGAAYTNGPGNAGIGPIESQFFCNLTGTMATLLYGAEFQFIMKGTGSANATVIQADLYGLAASPGIYSSAVNYRGIIGPLNGVTATLINGVDIESGGFATQLGIAAVNTLNVRNYFAGCMVGSLNGLDTAGGYTIGGYVGGIPKQGGNTSGTNTNYGVHISSGVPNGTGGTPGTGGTVNNYTAHFSVPTAADGGAGSTLHNVGVMIDGSQTTLANGGVFALHVNTLATSVFRGTLILNPSAGFTQPSVLNTQLLIQPSFTVASASSTTWRGVYVAAVSVTLTGGVTITNTNFNASHFDAPTITSVDATTVTSCGTVVIGGEPIAAGVGPVAITNPYAFWVQSGHVRIVPTVAIVSAASATWHGFNIAAAIATISGAVNITTAGGLNLVTIAAPALVATGLAVTNSATLSLVGPPTISGGGTITNPITLWLGSGVATVAGGALSSALAIGTTGTAPALTLRWGSGAPTISAPKGSLYLRTDGSTTNDRAYINTDAGTTWTALTTAI